MPHGDVQSTIGLLAMMLLVAKVAGWLSMRFGQPAVLDELNAGVLLGESIFGVANRDDGTLHVFAEIAVIVLRTAELHRARFTRSGLCITGGHC